jgi:hypothetical protein
VFVWQQSQVMDVRAKAERISKTTSVIANSEDYKSQLVDALGSVTELQNLFYPDSDDVELIIQRDIEEIFSAHDVNISSFNWLVDSSRPALEGVSYRKLRASINFGGGTANMMETFWMLEASPKLISISDWHQQIRNYESDSLGATSGRVTLEFFTAGLTSEYLIESGVILDGN